MINDSAIHQCVGHTAMFGPTNLIGTDRAVPAGSGNSPDPRNFPSTFICAMRFTPVLFSRRTEDLPHQQHFTRIACRPRNTEPSVGALSPHALSPATEVSPQRHRLVAAVRIDFYDALEVLDCCITHCRIVQHEDALVAGYL